MLQPSIAAFNLLTTKLVHGIYYPYSLFTTLHALRVTVIFQHNVRASGNKGKLTWGNYISGFLIMAWGGTVFSNLLLTLPPPYLYNHQPWLNYISVHLLATAFFHFFPSTLDLPTLDPLFTPLDALLRSTSIAGALSLLTTPGTLPPSHAALASSSFTPIVIGAIAASGGGLMAGTLKVWTNDWALGTVSIFRVGTGVVGSTDVWSGALGGFVYTLLTRPTLYPAFFSSYILTRSGKTGQLIPYAPQDARAAVSLVLLAVFAWRTFVVHYLPSAVPAVSISVKKQIRNGQGQVKANTVITEKMGDTEEHVQVQESYELATIDPLPAPSAAKSAGGKSGSSPRKGRGRPKKE